jgi:hypothetical protein
MKIENKLSEITKLMENIKKHSDSLNGLGTIPVLQIAVILSKINKLQEQAIVLKHLCEIQQGKRVDLHPIELYATAVSNEEDVQESTEKKNEPKPVKDEVVEEDAMLSEKEDDTNDALDQMVEATIHVEEEKEKPSADNEVELETTEEDDSENQTNQSAELNEDFLNKILGEARDDEKEAGQADQQVEQLEDKNEISSKPDINEAFTTEDSSISGHLQKQPITDLMSAIGLNERYLYANELFEGDMQEFKNAIKMLNEFESVMEAKSFFESGLRNTYGWEDDNELAQALFNLIERRYL